MSGSLPDELWREIAYLWDKRDIASLWNKRDIASLWDKRDIASLWNKRDIASLWDKSVPPHCASGVVASTTAARLSVQPCGKRGPGDGRAELGKLHVSSQQRQGCQSPDATEQARKVLLLANTLAATLVNTLTNNFTNTLANAPANKQNKHTHTHKHPCRYALEAGEEVIQNYKPEGENTNTLHFLFSYGFLNSDIDVADNDYIIFRVGGDASCVRNSAPSYRFRKV
jgi:hypothetical protein